MLPLSKKIYKHFVHAKAICHRVPNADPLDVANISPEGLRFPSVAQASSLRTPFIFEPDAAEIRRSDCRRVFGLRIAEGFHILAELEVISSRQQEPVT